MRNCCGAAFVAVHNNAPRADCQMRLMQCRVGNPRIWLDPAACTLAWRSALPHSPAPMPSRRPHLSRLIRLNSLARAGLALCLLGFTLASAAQEPDLAASGAAIATGSDLLETAIDVEKLEAADPPGRPHARFVPVGRLEAGDEVHYTIRVRNPGQKPVTDVQVTKRMPLGLHYLAGSASGPACVVEFSTDGGKAFSATPPDGEFTHLRWTLRRPIPADSTVLLRFRATFR